MHLIWTGERTRLRPFKSADEFVQLSKQLGIEDDETWGPGWEPVSPLVNAFEEHAMLGGHRRFKALAIERLDTQELVGCERVQLPQPQSIRLEIGTSILKQHQHCGFGREAKLLAMCLLFEHFPIQDVCAETLVKHQRAVAGLEACGMSCEGAWRMRAYSQGRWEDQAVYLISRTEWLALPIRQRVKRG